jgi:hypothetical protein
MALSVSISQRQQHLITYVCSLLLFTLVGSSFASLDPTIALDTSTELYLYSWPLVMTFLTRKSMFYCPDNRMMPLPVFPNPNLTAIVKPNVDTLYDACWIDHTKADDLLLTIPNTEDGLYFLFPLMDAWTNIVESPGWRTTGKEETKVLIRGPFASSPEPDPSLYDLIIHSPTTMTYLLGRTNVANQSDLRPTQEQLFSYEFGPLNEQTLDKRSSPAATTRFPSDLALAKKNTVDEIFAMSAREYYELFTRLLVENPPIYPQDDDIVKRMGEAFGMIPGLIPFLIFSPDHAPYRSALVLLLSLP